MATTLSNFVKVTNAALIGSTVQAAGALVALNPSNATQIASGGGGTILDVQSFDLSKAGFAKNAGVFMTLTSTTAITLDFTALAAATGVVVAGDSSFATWNQIIFYNTGAVDLTVNTAGSNGLRLLNGGTSPTYTVPAGSRLVLESVAGLAVDSTHKGLTVTPTSGGSLGVCIGGA